MLSLHKMKPTYVELLGFVTGIFNDDNRWHTKIEQ